MLLEEIDCELGQSQRLVLGKLVLSFFLGLGSIPLLGAVVLVAVRKFLILLLDHDEFANEDRVFAHEHELSLGYFLKNSGFAEYAPEVCVDRKATTFQAIEHGLFAERSACKLHSFFDVVQRSEALLWIEGSLAHDLKGVK